MAKKKLYKTPEELITGYGLPLPGTKRGRKKGASENKKVMLRAKVLNSGNVQVYLYTSYKGKPLRVSVGVLNIEKDEGTKARNVEIMRMAEAEEGVRNADALRLGHGLEPQPKRNIILSDYLQRLINGKEYSIQTRRIFDMLLHHVEIFRTAQIKISFIDAKWLRDFLLYLKTEACNRNVKSRRKPLTENTVHRMFETLEIVLSRAKRDAIITESPMHEISTKERPRLNREAREYLTVEEVRALIDTPTERPSMKRAFLLSVFTGLRWSDITRLTWNDIKEDDNGKLLHITMKKTAKPISVYLSSIGARFLPERPNGEDGSAPIFRLPSNKTINTTLRKWTATANITKHVSFHVARHTFATMMLNGGASLEVVAKMLGHERLSTTEIYAKIINRTIAAAAHKQDEIFKE